MVIVATCSLKIVGRTKRWAWWNKTRSCAFFVWAIMDSQKFAIPVGEVVKIDTLHYYLLLLKARCRITNSSVERGLSFRGKHTFYLNTWHGTAIKKMGADIGSNNKSFGTKSKESYLNVMLAQGQYDIDVFSQAFKIPKDKFRLTGLPRNDELVDNSFFSDIRERVCKQFDISADKTIILYAPTFREYSKDLLGNCTVNIPINVVKWQDCLSGEFVVLFRAHYVIAKGLNVTDSDFWKDVSNYENLNELMIASDMLISDYSSIFFDYSIMGKPMLCYAYDYDLYQHNRGLYFDIRKELDCEMIYDEDSLLKDIIQMDYQKRTMKALDFKSKFIQEYGSSANLVLNVVSKELMSK